MTSLHSKICNYFTTGDQDVTHKLKPRSFIKLYSTPTSFTCHWSLLLGFILSLSNIPLWHSTLLHSRVYFYLLLCTSVLRNSILDSIEAIAGLIPIVLHLCKLNRCHYLYYALIPSSYAINSIFDSQHTKGYSSHKFSTSNLTIKQNEKLKSPIKDINEWLSEITQDFHLLHSIFSPSSRLVDHFSSRISFYSPLSSNDKDLHKHIQKLNHTFHIS